MIGLSFQNRFLEVALFPSFNVFAFVFQVERVNQQAIVRNNWKIGGEKY